MSYSSAPAQSAQGNFLGQVKWFNAKAGFGYITVMDGDRKGEDVFVHHSAINVSDRMYKYLVQGEYVGFAIGKSQSDKHEFQVETVGGLGDGGKLMCETRHENQRARPRAAGANRGGQGGRGGRRPRRAPARREVKEEGKEVFVDNGQDA